MAEITDDYLTLPMLATKRTLITSFKKWKVILESNISLKTDFGRF